MAEKICIYLLALSVVVSFPGLAHAEERVYVNGFDSNYPPFAYLDSRGNPDGLDIKAIEWIAREMGFKVRHEPTEWDSVVACLKEKGIDLVASGMSITREMKEQVWFTIPYWSIRKVIATGRDSDLTADQILDNGRKLAVLRGTSEAEWIEENLVERRRKRIVLVYYDSAPKAVNDLLRGKVAGAAMSDLQVKDAAKNNAVKVAGSFGMPDEQFGYAVRKEDVPLLETLNGGLMKLMASPYWEELKKRYME
ncbi:MAG: amino acid ABC transporter substrate-binding protein [Desulfobacteraceae bacterium]|nr:MAG: amino acid ABC transporter substrate-binding protein [Desulfobacteraceae bacterium]